ncbi:S8 family peptidase [Aquimarina sp. MMG016]|uniref:S8 family peptidase n=1 Tax=Aquimarina sp. MMG016 TaxID=2822690 RepID=UPI001B3A0C14|nr:S8 family peptidase [Aquimarina sp. MMG016]MBQ4818598.1 S8 family serine peptidase [Aquimarina sp. MMG016]
MTKQLKKYIVTFHEGNVSTKQVQEILGLSKRNYKEGNSFLASDEEIMDEDVVNFEELGVASVTLSESEVSKLEKNDRVMAVEEDIEMGILEVENYIEDDITVNINGGDIFFKEDFQESEGFENEFENYDYDIVQEPEIDNYYYPEEYNLDSTDFQDGAEKTMNFVLKSLLNSNGASENISGPTTPTLPKFPIKNPRLNPLKPIKPFPFFRYKYIPIPWNIHAVKATNAWRRGITGRGVKVAVLDTGITRHPDLYVRGGVSFIPGSTSYLDKHSHGTHCAGIIAGRNNNGVVGVAPGASLYAVKVLNDSGRGNMSWIIAGMNWCVTNRIDIASMSLGGASAPIVAYAQAVQRCQAAGVTIVIASGNSYGSSFPWVCSPANSILRGSALASPIAVGATDFKNRIARFSSRGGKTSQWNQVDVVAPGVYINSTVLRNGYCSKSGTSMACPHVAGAAALIKQRFRNLSPLQIKYKLQRSALDLGRRGYDNTYGSGIINCDKATL